MSFINFSGITNAFAQATQTASPSTTTSSTSQGGSLLHMLPMLIIFIVVFYFLLVRPQTKRAKDQKQMLSSVAVNDEVMTAGGIIGRIIKLKDNYAILNIGKGLEIIVQKSSVASVLPKGTMDSLES